MFFIRHQAGMMWEFPFAEHPTEAQIAAVKAICASRHGDKHKKTQREYWIKIVEIPVLGPGDTLPEAEPRGNPISTIGKPTTPGPKGSGKAHIENPPHLK